MRSSRSLAAAAAAALCAAPLAAQRPAPRAGAPSPSASSAPRAESRARTMTFDFGDEGADDRPVIGVSTTSSGERDTLGVLVVGVTAGGPADRAGVGEGDRIAAVNGVNLRLAAADAGERDMNGLTTRRLAREIAKAKPGADVELRVWSGGAFRTVKVKTVAAAELPGRTVRFTRADVESRGVLGLSLGGGGSRRDTLGLLVSRVETDGPAEKAGIVEGDRIASVNGADLRVAREDVGDGWVSAAKSSRFTRALQGLEPGEKVTLRVYSGGQTKTVDVTAAKSADVYRRTSGVFLNGDMAEAFDGMGPMGAMTAPMPPMPPMPAMGPMDRSGPAPRVRIGRPNADGDVDFQLDTEAVRAEVERALDAARAGMQAGVRAGARAYTLRRGTTSL